MLVTNQSQSKYADRLFIILILLFTAWQCAMVLYAPLPLAPDEAHYWEWSRRLDYNYYSKGPIVAWLIAAATPLFGTTEFAVRVPALFLSFLLSITWYLLVRQWFGATMALASWLALRTTLFFATLGMVITTDPPVLIFWLLWLAAGLVAIREERPLYWLVAAVALSLAVLSKFTAIILLPSVMLFLLLTPSKRHHLRSLCFWLGVGVLGLSLLPVILWNYHHHWITFAHNAAHLGSQTGIRLKPSHVAELLGGQAGLIGPLLLYLIYPVVREGYRVWRSGDASAGFLLFSSLPLMVVCLALSFTKTVYVNWPMPIYLGFGLLACHLVSIGTFSLTKAQQFLSRSLRINLVILVVGVSVILGATYGLPVERLPIKKLVGWEEVGNRVEQELALLRKRYGDDIFILTDDYGIASEIAFYAPSHPQVYCANIGGRRMNQYDVWGGLDELGGHAALIVRKYDDTAVQLQAQFDDISRHGEPLAIYYKGQLVRTFYFDVGTNYNPTLATSPGRY